MTINKRRRPQFTPGHVCLALCCLLLSACETAVMRQDFRLHVEQPGMQGVSMKVDPVTIELKNSDRDNEFYWAAVVMERDGEDGPADDFVIIRDNISTEWIRRYLPAAGTDESSRISETGLLKAAVLPVDSPERPVVFLLDAIRYAEMGFQRPYVILHNPDCPGARTSHPTTAEYCSGTLNSPDDIVAMIGAGRIRPLNEKTVVLRDIQLTFPVKPSIIEEDGMEYYVLIILYDSSSNADVVTAKSPATFSHK